jgi:hypothetical protein
VYNQEYLLHLLELIQEVVQQLVLCLLLAEHTCRVSWVCRVSRVRRIRRVRRVRKVSRMSKVSRVRKLTELVAEVVQHQHMHLAHPCALDSLVDLTECTVAWEGAEVGQQVL